jgi:hypothetical protein
MWFGIRPGSVEIKLTDWIVFAWSSFLKSVHVVGSVKKCPPLDEDLKLKHGKEHTSKQEDAEDTIQLLEI